MPRLRASDCWRRLKSGGSAFGAFGSFALRQKARQRPNFDDTSDDLIQTWQSVLFWAGELRLAADFESESEPEPVLPAQGSPTILLYGGRVGPAPSGTEHVLRRPQTIGRRQASSTLTQFATSPFGIGQDGGVAIGPGGRGAQRRQSRSDGSSRIDTP